MKFLLTLPVADLFNTPRIWDEVSESYPFSSEDLQKYGPRLNRKLLALNPHLSEDTLSDLLLTGGVSGKTLASRPNLSPSFISRLSSCLDHPTLKSSGYSLQM